MRKTRKGGGECIGRATALTQFRHVYRFILKAVECDSEFQGYLAGELSEELLAITRRWVNKDQAGPRSIGSERNPERSSCVVERTASGDFPHPQSHRDRPGPGGGVVLRG
jgi:hypothetical protein